MTYSRRGTCDYHHLPLFTCILVSFLCVCDVRWKMKPRPYCLLTYFIITTNNWSCYCGVYEKRLCRGFISKCLAINGQPLIRILSYKWKLHLIHSFLRIMMLMTLNSTFIFVRRLLFLFSCLNVHVFLQN